MTDFERREGPRDAGPNKFTIHFHPRTYENRWTRYRAKVLDAIGLSSYEIDALKYNRMTNPFVAAFLKDIRAEVIRIGIKYGLGSYEEAADYRKAHFVELLDTKDIEDDDVYWRMGYHD
jgi:hypothetical protein